ncbi:unnamed protein product [Trifolium pratense]|uniref:Uncharacterized protein n=1 Tax=Trifolium pratense TaxID=57577 RepID=A0ACB0KN96_TRIPR|nr:unnamed protein product [Trifolium pratense]
MPLMSSSVVKLAKELVFEPITTLTNILYYGNHLPRNLNLERLVSSEFLHQQNYFFHFLTTMLRCVW